mmetsp:Transcript_62199/g.117549  ORF Transcript_62199/g.117549 Transcript_62199/m.117549 type:complete len:909 (-) Transcript_62199:45-2771(-)
MQSEDHPRIESTPDPASQTDAYHKIDITPRTLASEQVPDDEGEHGQGQGPVESAVDLQNDDRAPENLAPPEAAPEDFYCEVEPATVDTSKAEQQQQQQPEADPKKVEPIDVEPKKVEVAAPQVAEVEVTQQVAPPVQIIRPPSHREEIPNSSRKDSKPMSARVLQNTAESKMPIGHLDEDNKPDRLSSNSRNSASFVGLVDGDNSIIPTDWWRKSEVQVLLVIGTLNMLLICWAQPTFRNPHTDELQTWQPYVVMNMVAISIFLMAKGLPADLILMAVSSLFCVIRIINVDELLEGLSNSGVVAVAVLCVVSKAIDKTKALNAIMGNCLGNPSSVPIAMLRLALPVASLGTVFNNTPLVAVMIPIVNDWTQRAGLEVSHFMMPLSFITMLSACITTMGSSTNLLAVDLVPEAHIQFLDLAPVGLMVMVVGVSYCCFMATLLLPANNDTVLESNPDQKQAPQQKGSYLGARMDKEDLQSPGETPRCNVDRYTVRFKLARAEGPLHDKSAAESGLLNCMAPPARIHFLRSADNNTFLEAGDQFVLANATVTDIASLVAVPGLHLEALGGQYRTRSHQERRKSTFAKEKQQTKTFGMPVRKWVAANVQGGWVAAQRELFEVIVAPGGVVKAGRSSTVGAISLQALQEPLSEWNCTLIAIRGVPPDSGGVMRLSGGEVLLVEALTGDFPHEAGNVFIKVLPVAEQGPPSKLILSPLDPYRPMIAVAGLASCVILSAFKIVELDAIAVLVGLGSILLGTLTSRELYGAINGPVLLTVAASFGVGSAFSKTGLASALAKGVLEVAEQSGPYAILGSIVALALTLGVVVSNNTTVILLAPLVKQISRRQNMDLKMMMLAIVYAANLSFATPFSYQTNMMVMPHGRYVFMDYVKFGVPMMLLCGLVALVGTIIVWG